MPENLRLIAELLPAYALRLGVAVLCGVALGLERERKDKAAGLRTVALITMGATVFMIVSDLIPVVTKGPESITRVDPSRVASQVVAGIGFLGAGSIIQSRGAVRGLTTAAVIWVAAGIGLCIGVGFPLLGGAVTAIVLGVLVVLDPVRRWMDRFGTQSTLELVVPNDDLAVRRVEATFRQHAGAAASVTVKEHSDDTLFLVLSYHISESATARLVEALARLEGVRGARRAASENGDSPRNSSAPPRCKTPKKAGSGTT